MNVFDLAATLTLDTSEYNNSLKEAEGSAQSLASSASQSMQGAEKSASGFGSALKTAGKVGAVAVTAVATAAAAAVGSIASATKETAAYGDNIDKMSQKLGLSAEAYQKWDYVLGQSGADINSMSTGLKTLTNQIDNAKNGSADAQAKFEALGISLEDLNSMSREEVFEAAISGFQGMADSTERAALANDLFGRSGQELTPLFNTSAEATEELKNAASELGFVMSDDAVKASAAYMDSLDTLQRTIGGIKNALTAEFMPAVTEVMDGLTMLFSGDEGGIEKIKQGVSDFVSTLSERLPEFVEAGAQILTTIITGLFENLPQLLEAGWEILKVLAESLLNLAGSLLEIGWEWILNITQGIRDKISDTVEAGQELWQNFKDNLHEKITEALEQGVEWITNLIQGIKDKISDTVAAGQELWQNFKSNLASVVGEILALGVEWIANLIQGIRNKIADTVQAGRDLIEQVKSTIRNAIANFREIGGQLMEGLKQGIVNKVQGIISAVRGAVQDAIGAAKRLLGIASPSKVFTQIGMFLDEGLAKGIEMFARKPIGAVKELADDVTGAFNGDLGVSATSRQNRSPYDETYDRPIILQVLLDGKVIGETSYNYIRRRTRMVGA